MTSGASQCSWNLDVPIMMSYPALCLAVKAVCSVLRAQENKDGSILLLIKRGVILS